MTIKKPKHRDDSGVSGLNLDLPPLDGDELHEIDPGVLVGFVEEGESLFEDEPLDAMDEFDPADFLNDFEEGSFIDDGGTVGSPEPESLVDVEELGWADAKGEAEIPVGDWFVTADDRGDGETDDGAQGPDDQEIYEIEESTFVEIGEGAEDDAEEDILDTMRRLGIMEEMFRAPDEAADIEAASDEVSFLGPEEGEVVAAAFARTTPVAVGEGVYVLGADNCLHAMPNRGAGPLGAVSVAEDQGVVFIGTVRGGALLTRDRGKTLSPINGWYTQGLKSPSVAVDGITTRFTVVGQRTTGGYRLCGYTGEGQLFSSLDAGQHWCGPASPGRCVALAPLYGTDGILAWFRAPGGQMFLALSEDLETWRTLDAPGSLKDGPKKGAALLAGGGDVILAGSDGRKGDLYLSRDRGNTWSAMQLDADITAVAVDPEDSDWIAVGAWIGERAKADVRVSDDRGETWRTVLTVNTFDSGRGRGASRVTALCLNSAVARQLMAVIGGEVYLAKISGQGFAH